MELRNNERNGKKFVTVLADGKFHQTVPEGTEGAVSREYEDKEGVKKTIFELVRDEVSGVITSHSFDASGSYGTVFKIEIDNDGEVSLNTKSNFGEDFMKKFPNIDLTKPVRLVPYAFKDKGKSLKGMTVYQDDVKIESAYWDKETKKSKGGVPEPVGDTSNFDSDDWASYFTTVRKFLIKQIEDNF